MRRSLFATALRASALAALGALVGLVVNAARADGIALERYRPPTTCSGPEPARQIVILDAAQAARRCGDSRTLVADVRDERAYAEGHIAGAAHLPCAGTSADLDRVRSHLATKTSLVIYGDSEAQGLRVARDLAARIGRPDLTIALIAGGWRAWSDGGLACASGPCDNCAETLNHAPR